MRRVLPAQPMRDGYPRHMTDASCPSGVCGADVPPLIGSVLTGTGMTLAQAAAAVERGETPPLTDLQRRLVAAWAHEHAQSV
jgi:hypothetical protein